MRSEYENLTLDETLKRLETDGKGLSNDQLDLRIKKYGYNEVETKHESLLMGFLMKFWAPVPWMLEITIIATYLLDKLDDMYIIIFLLFFNSILSFAQESRAQSAVELLKSKLYVMARVRRDGKWIQVKARDLVPGDLIHIRNGDSIPADCKIVDGELQVDQSSLTGESLPVECEAGRVVYAGSTARGGESSALVVATGSKTLFGKTTELVAISKSQSHIEKLIVGIVKYLIAIDTLLVLSLGIFSYLSGYNIGTIIPFALVVLITSIPVALPAMFTIAMSIGAEEMSRKGAIVTHLTAIEDAAGMDVLCLDKTGTITTNTITVKEVKPYGISSKDLILYALIASDESSEDAIDDAVISYAKSSNISSSSLKRTEFKPFDPHTKRTEAVIVKNGQKMRVIKGSPPILMNIYRVPEEMNKDIEEASKNGFRTIAIALDDGEKKLVGIMSLFDPPRKDSNELIREIKELNITPKMVTGDSVEIAGEVSDSVSIGGKVDRIAAIKDNPEEIEKTNIFAEVFPEDKHAIVRSLQFRGHTVGMTGDGVNDAPALRQAEVGIAVSNGTDVAKAAASIVLTHEGLSDIVEAVKSGRRIYQRMLTYILNKIIKTIQVVFFLTISFFIFRFFATTPFDIILLIFANDFVTMSIATDNARYSPFPEKWKTKQIVLSSVILGALLVVEGILALSFALYMGLNHFQIDTFVFDLLVFSGQFTVYMVRERDHFWKSMPGKWLITATIGDMAIIITISLFGILVFPLPIFYILFTLGLSFIWMVFMDTFKNIIFKKYKI